MKYFVSAFNANGSLSALCNWRKSLERYSEKIKIGEMACSGLDVFISNHVQILKYLTEDIFIFAYASANKKSINKEIDIKDLATFFNKNELIDCANYLFRNGISIFPRFQAIYDAVKNENLSFNCISCGTKQDLC